jgi:hypothetical protein
VEIRSAPGAPVLQLTADISWLPPTARNLAMLSVPIPAGFRQVPLIRAITPMLARIPVVPLPLIYGASPSSFAGGALSRLGARCLAPAATPAATRSPLPAPALSPPATPRLPVACLYEQGQTSG